MSKAHALSPFRCFALAAASLLLGGCLVGPDFVAPTPAAPERFSEAPSAAAGQPSETAVSGTEQVRWWRQFDDATLDRLVTEAIEANLDLQLAQTRLREARAERGIAAAGLWPSVGASASYQRARTAGAPGDHDLFQAGLDAAWELDLFGGRRRNLESAEATVLSAVEAIRDAQVSLVAEVALNYLQLRSYQQETAIAQKNLQAQRRTADIIRRQFKAGFASALDLANAEATVASTEAQIPVFETAERQGIHALGVLLGRYPGELLPRLSAPAGLPAVPKRVPAGLPSELLRRRPDVREAEAKLHAATAQIGVAVADFFPSFSLTGSLNWNSNLLRSWWSGASRSFGVGPAVNWQIFQGGAVAANVRLQEALRDEAGLNYRKTVLTAFQEVEDALVSFAKEQEHRKSLSEAVTANRRAVELSLRLYGEGQIDFLSVVVAQRALYAAEDSLVQSDRNLAVDLVALYKALGGGAETLSAADGRHPGKEKAGGPEPAVRSGLAEP